MGELIFLKPVFKDVIWGGNKLGTEWKYDIPSDTTGECWGISAHPNGDCEILNGEFKGETLSKLWENHKELFGNINSEVFPLLIKIIDAKADLSIQVHPDDAYAKQNENGSLGKTECWYILDCEEGAKLVIGHHAKDKKEMEEMILQKRWNEFIQEVEIKKGDFIQIDPGTLHAIKGGTVILETQQNSDITYRVYDYDRLQNGKPRQLHVQQSIDTIKAPAMSIDKCISHPEAKQKNQEVLMIQNNFYKVCKLEVENKAALANEKTFICVSVIDGKGTANGSKVKKGDHFLVPANSGEIKLEGEFTIIYSTVGK